MVNQSLYLLPLLVLAERVKTQTVCMGNEQNTTVFYLLRYANRASHWFLRRLKRMGVTPLSLSHLISGDI